MSEKSVLTLAVMNFFKVWKVLNSVSKYTKQDGGDDDDDENMMIFLSS